MIKPGSLFSDGAVLQQGLPIPVWGETEPGDNGGTGRAAGVLPGLRQRGFPAAVRWAAPECRGTISAPKVPNLEPIGLS